jgi:hypothetical protein
MKILPIFLLGVVCSMVLQITHASEPLPPPGPGVDVTQITFGPQPSEQGLSFVRAETKATTVEVLGKKYDAWVAEKSAAPAKDGTPSFRFNVTDPKFQKGGRPVVELEAVCFAPNKGSITIRADTADGNKAISTTGTRGTDWETIRVRLDNAFFGARPDTGSVKPSLDGIDFRIDAANGPLYVRSVRLVGYDPDHDVVWAKLLKATQFSTGGPEGILVLHQATAQKFALTVQNLAHIPANLNYRLEILNYNDKAIYTETGKLAVAPSSTTTVSSVADATSWPLGPYDANVEAFAEDKPEDVLFKQRFRIGLISMATLDKARDGEFLYGLDTANGFPVHTKMPLAYYRLMGVDILRNLYEAGMREGLENVAQSLADLAPENVQASLMSGPPQEVDPAKLAAALQEKDAFLEEAGRLYGGKGPGKIHYVELGNEPDLPGFFHGSPADYVRRYEEMRDSFKRGTTKAGLADSDTVVTTGGLSFAGMAGPINAAEIIKDLDPSKIDAIAYHGHGPGIMAERKAYERAHAAAEKYGKANHPFMETESGFSGQEHRGLQEQARTAVEKLVYAQTKQEPLLMFFRLFMSGDPAGMEGGYGLTDNFIEPHPSILAYRNVVERLRHQAFAATLDIAGKTGIPDVDAFVFQEKNATGGLTGRKTLVVFSEGSTSTDIRFRLDQPKAAVGDATLFDMYGNASTPALTDAHITTVSVGPDPLFLSWNSSGDPSTIEVVPPLLSLVGHDPLLVNAPNSVGVMVHNADSQPMDATVTLLPQMRVGATASPTDVHVTVPAGGLATASFTVTLQKAASPLSLPIWWKAFVDVDANQLNLTGPGIPESLPKAGGVALGTYVWAPGHRVDFAKLAGGFGNKRAAVAFATLDAPEDLHLSCAANADWYMAWYLNGAKVYDTLEIGNRGGSMADHPFDLSLKKGPNVIAVEVLSGGQGWNFDFGGPKERQIALKAGDDPDRLMLTVKSNGKDLESLSAPVQLQATVPPLSTTEPLDQLSTWMPLEPLGVLGEESVKNLWMKEPDTSRWYGGAADLSGKAWLRDSGKTLDLFVAVTDDKQVDAPDAAHLKQGDSVRMVLADDAGTPLVDLTGGIIGGKPALDQVVKEVSFAASRSPDAGASAQTLYHFTLPKTIVGAGPFRLNLSVLDNDSTFLKQTLDLGDVNHPSAGLRLKTND